MSQATSEGTGLWRKTAKTRLLHLGRILSQWLGRLSAAGRGSGQPRWWWPTRCHSSSCRRYRAGGWAGWGQIWQAWPYLVRTYALKLPRQWAWVGSSPFKDNEDLAGFWVSSQPCPVEEDADAEGGQGSCGGREAPLLLRFWKQLA